jgi:ubiquinol-cytochrome c reductase cytochrome b subunit
MNLEIGKKKSLERIGPHNYEVLCLIYGSLLGDSFAEYRGKGVRIVFQQESSNVEYLMWFHKFLSDRGYCSPNKPKLFKRIAKGGKVRFYYRIRTWTFSSFLFIWESFYNGGPKKVPKDLEIYLSPLALAIWFQDDGSVVSTSIKISTNCFSYEDVSFLCEILKKKYNIHSTPHRDGTKWVLYIRKHSLNTFSLLVKPYMVPSMYYKLNQIQKKLS